MNEENQSSTDVKNAIVALSSFVVALLVCGVIGWAALIGKLL